MTICHFNITNKNNTTNPADVNSKKIILDQVVYTSKDEHFSIAIGTGDGGNAYENAAPRFAVRWNGKSETEKGFPTSNGHPMWFQLPNDKLGDIIKTIVENVHKIKQT